LIRQVGFLKRGFPRTNGKIEVSGWFEKSLAKLQAAVIEQVTKATDLSPFGKIVSPDRNGNFIDRAAASFCDNQRVRNTSGYQTFSFLWLMVVVCVGAVIILLKLWYRVSARIF
jgi:hypothetical protein